MPRPQKMPQYRALNGAVEWLDELLTQGSRDENGWFVIKIEEHQLHGLREDIVVYKQARSRPG